MCITGMLINSAAQWLEGPLWEGQAKDFKMGSCAVQIGLCI